MKFLDNFILRMKEAIFDLFRRRNELVADTSQYSQVEQKLLEMHYRHMLHSGMPTMPFGDVGFRVFSESNEDGILLYIFSLIGTTNKQLVDIGAAVSGSNTANLIVNHGWTGLLIDGAAERAAATRQFYNSRKDCNNYPPTVLCGWVTRENVDELISAHGIKGGIDLLSIDIDGVDYYIWETIECVSPRVVVVEYQCIWGPEISVSVPYTPDFKGGFVGPYGVYSGASLAAFVKLAKKKGYRLVGSHRYGYNAFFVRNDVGQEIFSEIQAEECFQHPFTAWAQKELLPKVKDMEWVEI